MDTEPVEGLARRRPRRLRETDRRHLRPVAWASVTVRIDHCDMDHRGINLCGINLCDIDED